MAWCVPAPGMATITDSFPRPPLPLYLRAADATDHSATGDRWGEGNHQGIVMNPDLDHLQPYPFERLAALKNAVSAPEGIAPISLAIGEPKHPTPHPITEAFLEHAHGLGSYPTTKGTPQLREAIAAWACARFGLPSEWVDPERHVIPVAGTREALFAIAQTVVDRTGPARVVMPNPCYQIYEGAALLAGATPYYLDTVPEHDYLPRFDSVPEAVWQNTDLVYICSPGNPTGAVIPEADLVALIELADRYDFAIASDECYSEIYPDERRPPPGLLSACAKMGRADFRRCLAFHSLSKRSNAPGLRSGFVAGDAEILKRFLLYRTYQGCALPLQTQAASIAAWSDEAHVRTNRDAYREKFRAVHGILREVLDVALPQGGFYLWPRIPGGDDARFAQRLYAQENVTVLPGRFLSRDNGGSNPGAGHVRIALVATVEECVEAAERIKHFITNHT